MTAASALFPGSEFAPGYTVIAREGEASPIYGYDTGMDFGIQCCSPGEIVVETHPKESVWVLLRGRAEIEFVGRQVGVSRTDLFDEPPTALHVSGHTTVTLKHEAWTEWAVIRTTNRADFAPHLFLPAALTPEYRGAGLVQNACLRNVRLIFDRTARPESNLVVGEVVNYPGRWSSYPPHHHDQPEIYHYRFTHANGYGHAENGATIHKVRHRDTLFISPGLDHAQVSAPGYGMYYLWMIRHLPGNPYTGFTFAEEHKWTLDPAQQGWRSAEPPPDFR
ncbi:MAG TPA: 5-deoxy-glucuronate isomerase [Candidatus Didemnitutus sp.]|nr:5-deoxy-glucuronate isomerase [Candidatus Didemnitutus sp.]